ncbi:MAG: GH92 family glycosyl hydrolase [Prevotellaceae bacterium]|jgi:predicted alpha-1,2-mannosidase|nr:GH92 family glycosyl hydrolase [Prevotellaceae bacterium]
MRKQVVILILALCAGMLSCEKAKSPIDYVNPNIGTVHSRWFFYTPAAEPFGMAKLGASTNGSYGNPSGWEAVGYEDNHTSIEGFPCLHEFQVGGIMLMPTVGAVQTTPGKMDSIAGGYRSAFDKKDEYATAGYYSVRLKDYNVKAELTATTRVGFQRYTFPASTQSNIIFDIGNRLGESGAVRDAYVKVTDNNIVEGYVVTEPDYVKKYQQGATVVMYFYAVVDKKAAATGTFIRGGQVTLDKQRQGVGAGAVLSYSTTEGEIIEVKVGLSYTSVENAKRNLEAEAAALNFDRAKKAAMAKWAEYLGRIIVKGGTEASKVKFYTGLYHALLGRGVASDVNGAYPKNDGTTGQIPLNANGVPAFNHYNTDGIWGGYWNLTLLWSMAYPEYYNDYVNSHLLVYDDAGWLGDGIAASKYVSGVGTNMLSIVFAGAYNCGIRGYDIEKAYQAALKNEMVSKGRVEGAGKMDVGQFVRLGYSPYSNVQSSYSASNDEGSSFSASHTLEYSFSAYAVAQWAKQLGKEKDYEQLMWLSKGWERLFDPELSLIRPRLADGSFIDRFNPLESWRGFQEGNAVQYTYFVPGDPNALIEKIGRETFNTRLDSTFLRSRENIFGGGKTVWAFAGIESPYNHGNQPNLHIPWLFNFSGKPCLTQQWTRRICDEFYGTDGEHGYGYGQDEDQGQLGAWYVMAALGLFDVQGGTSAPPTFQIGSPQFERMEIKLSPVNASGEKFIIETEGNTPDALYVQSATLNGAPLDNCWFFRDAFYRGGTLKLKMGAAPNTDWGSTVAPFYSK